jgi:uncharacterized small protein (DUF1192 family)
LAAKSKVGGVTELEEVIAALERGVERWRFA